MKIIIGRFLSDVLLIFVLCLMFPLPCNAGVPTSIHENWEDPYYQTTTWEESNIYHIDCYGMNQTYWYAEGSINPQIPLKNFFWSVKLVNRSIEDYGGLEIFIDGRHGEGVVWLEKKYSFSSLLYKAVGTVLYISSEYDNSTQNWPVLVYMGFQDPENETILRGLNNQGVIEPRSEKKLYDYYYNFDEPIQEPFIFYHAFGISIASEENRTYYVGDLWSHFLPIDSPLFSRSSQPTSGFLLVGTLVSLVVVTIHFVRKKRINRINSI